MTSKTCSKCKQTKATSDFSVSTGAPDGLNRYCKQCISDTRKARRAARRAGATKPVAAAKATAAYEQAIANAPAPTAIRRSTLATDYKPSREVVATWAAVQLIAADGGLAPNMLFLGPSGSGKTACAEYLAHIAGLPFTKVDAPSMTDPESWFGTREVVTGPAGTPITVVRDSAFVTAIQQRGVCVVDEVNRTPDAIRNILLALMDDSRAVTNPLTGRTVVRHPECFVIMTGNVGLQFTGTYAVDPALLTRCLTTNFEYLTLDAETELAVSRTGCSAEHAALFARFAMEARMRATQVEDFPPVSTREVLVACSLVARGLDPNTAAHQVIINQADASGGAESVRATLERIWTGIRPRV